MRRYWHYLISSVLSAFRCLQIHKTLDSRCRWTLDCVQNLQQQFWPSLLLQTGHVSGRHTRRPLKVDSLTLRLVSEHFCRLYQRRQNSRDLKIFRRLLTLFSRVFVNCIISTFAVNNYNTLASQASHANLVKNIQLA